MSHVDKLNIKRVEGIAIWMAPALRDKYDFSDPAHFDDLAKLSFQAAFAIVKYSDGLLAEAMAKDAAEMAERAKAAEAKVNKVRLADHPAKIIPPNPEGGAQ